MIKTRNVVLGLGALVTLVTAGAAYAADSIDGAADTPSRVAVRVDPPMPAVVIGDSAISAPAVGAGRRQRRDRIRAHARSRVVPAALHPVVSGREGRTPPTVFEALTEHGRKYKILVVATGYNEGSSTMAMSFQNVVQRARSLGYQQIVWWTLRGRRRLRARRDRSPTTSRSRTEQPDRARPADDRRLPRRCAL